MDTNERQLLFKYEVFHIVGCAIEVLNTLGQGLVGKSAVVTTGLRLEQVFVDHTLSGAPFESDESSPCALAWPNGFRACACIAGKNRGAKARRRCLARRIAFARTRTGLYDRADS